MPQPSIFLSHNYRDKPFVRTPAQDLSAMGVKVWLDEAELKVGDSLITRVSSAIDEMQYLGVVLSPHSVDSRWVKEELNQALIGQLSKQGASVLPIMLADCQVPGFLRDRLYADFRDPGDYDNALRKLLVSMGVENFKGRAGQLIDPFAERLGRVLDNRRYTANVRPAPFAKRRHSEAPIAAFWANHWYHRTVIRRAPASL